MADDKAGNQAADAVHVEHWCQAQGCKRWGCFGYDRGRGVTDWWCGEHKPAYSSSGMVAR